jgi:glycopeptide antibiotics resistance protein
MNVAMLHMSFRVGFVVALGAILWLALSYQPPIAATLFWDKGNHLLAFFALALLLDFGWSGYWWKWIGLWLLGCVIEVTQWWSGYRLFELWDICADTIGIALYVVLQMRFRNTAWLASLRQS